MRSTHICKTSLIFTSSLNLLQEKKEKSLSLSHEGIVIVILHAYANKLFGIEKTPFGNGPFFQMCLFFISVEPPTVATLTTVKPTTRKYVSEIISIFLCVSIRKAE